MSPAPSARLPAEPDGILGALIEDTWYAPPSELAARVADVAVRRLGATEVVVYLASYEQRILLPLSGQGIPHREPLEIDHTLAGRAFRGLQVIRSEAESVRLWVPLVEGTSRMGVLEIVMASVDEQVEGLCLQLAGLVALLIATKGEYSDVFALGRRTEGMTMAAEMQWDNLPPLTFSDGRVTISAMLEPSYRVAGDTLDYALNDGTLHLAVIDAMGHGFEATMMASVATGVYRHARRASQDLPETYAAMDDAIVRQFGLDRFVTAQVVRLDSHTGRLQWLNAGHPPPLLTRGNSLIGALSCEPSLPIGFGGAVAEIAEHQLQPGDRVLFVTDGVLDARSPEGEFFGEERLGDHIVRASTAELPAPETVRRLTAAVLEHSEGGLQDDATTVLVEWAGREPTETVHARPPRP